ncbi:MAG: hypothetical protein JSR82_08840 [Verrucomicrobia bacterium]|nr:hypothetical protein [Verrucomicrobiota bacterium]
MRNLIRIIFWLFGTIFGMYAGMGIMGVIAGRGNGMFTTGVEALLFPFVLYIVLTLIFAVLASDGTALKALDELPVFIIPFQVIHFTAVMLAFLLLFGRR